MGIRNVSFSCEQNSKATPETVWSIISSWERVTEFWKGTREITPIEENLFQVRFAFPGTARMRFLLDQTGMTLTEEYLSGPFKGWKKTSVTEDNGKTRLKTEWNVVLSPLLMFGRTSIQKHFSEGTENALKRIAEASEASS